MCMQMYVCVRLMVNVGPADVTTVSNLLRVCELCSDRDHCVPCARCVLFASVDISRLLIMSLMSPLQLKAGRRRFTEFETSISYDVSLFRAHSVIPCTFSPGRVVAM